MREKEIKLHWGRVEGRFILLRLFICFSVQTLPIKVSLGSLFNSCKSFEIIGRSSFI